MGIRRVLAVPAVYEAWSRLVGGEQGRRTLVREYVRPWAGARVLDLGCGPGALVAHLGDVKYLGIDLSAEYVEKARRSFGGRAEFRVGDATSLDSDLSGFDLVLAFGLIHHLDDDRANHLMRQASASLVPGGRFVSVDPTRIPGQRGPLARMLISWDRGEYVRTPRDYLRLAETVFESVRSSVRTDLLRLPYSLCIVEGVVR
jgi:SAM-dependent methyltransferase